MAKSWTGRGGKSSYGKTALSAKFSVSGMEDFFSKIEAAGKNVDKICRNAINEVLPIIENTMKEGAEKHRREGDVVNAIEVIEAKQQGNYIYAQVGIDLDKHPEAFEAVFQEYGDGHSPEFPDPFVRPSVDNNRRQINSIIKKKFKKEGMPVD